MSLLLTKIRAHQPQKNWRPISPPPAKKCILLFFDIALNFPLLSLYLESVVGPAAELHDARLLVKGEVLDVYLARRLVDGGRLPLHQAVEPDGGLGGQRHLEVAISAGKRSKLFTINGRKEQKEV